MSGGGYPYHVTYPMMHVTLPTISLYVRTFALLPPANKVWGKVIFLHLFVILFTGGGVPGPGRGLHPGGGAWSRGVPGLGGLVPGGACSGGAWLRPPRTANAASYWNAFSYLLISMLKFQ